MTCPAAIPAIALLAGAALGTYWPDAPRDAAGSVIVLAWACALVGLVCADARGVVAGTALGCAAAGILAGSQAEARARRPPLARALETGSAEAAGAPLMVEGILRSDAAPTDYGAALELHVDRVTWGAQTLDVRGGVRLAVGGSMTAGRLTEWRAGRRLRVPALVRPPARFLNRGVSDQAHALARRGIEYVGTVKSAALVEVLERGSAASEAAAEMRAVARRVLAASLGPWSATSAAVVTAVVIGDRAGLTSDIEERLQAAGTYHVIAISGGNIAILAGVVLWTLRRLWAPPAASAIVTIAALAAYGYVVAGGPSVNRATLVAICYLAARLVDHRARPLNSLAIAATFIGCADPLVILDVGFALTFGAALAIVVGADRMMRWVQGRHTKSPPDPRRSASSRWQAPLMLLAATICAELALFPISARVFARVTAAGLVLNFAAIPLMTLGQLAGLATLAIAPLGDAAARATGYVGHLAASGLIESTRLLDWAPWLSVRVPPPEMGVIALYYVALGVAVWMARQFHIRRWAGVTAAACGVWIVAAPVPPAAVSAWLSPVPGFRRASGVASGVGSGFSRACHSCLRVTVLDVAQGDATLVQFPGGTSLLVDAAGLAGTTTFDVGARYVVPAAWALGVRRLDYLALTHGDEDHIGGAPAVVRDLRVREVWEGVPIPPHVALREIGRLAGTVGAGWRTLQSGDVLQVGGVVVRVWHPPLPEWERQRIRNDDSVVLELRLHDVSIVLPGDIGRPVEEQLAARLSLAPVTVVKVPHHGSGGSSSKAFVDAVRPAVAIVSAGRANRFGHPTPQVLARYRDVGAAMFRTDEDGAVAVTTDGHEVTVETMSGRMWRMVSNRQ